VDYILVRRAEISTVTNVTVIRTEQSLLQHKLLVGTFQLGKCTSKKGRRYICE